jgi:hypothetical protein
VKNAYFGAVLACVIALFSPSAIALFLDPCFEAGQARFVPPNLAPNDPIGFKLKIPWNAGVSYPYHQYKYYWVRQSVADAGTFVIDVIVTDDATSFDGYTLVDDTLPYWGFLGPLPSGSYTVLGTINVYDPSSGAIRPECDPAQYGPAQKASILYVNAPENPYFQWVRVPQEPVVEFYNRTLDHYFMTMNVDEIASLNSGTSGWQITGERFFAYPWHSGSGLNEVLRYYGLPEAGLDSHFFAFSPETASLSSAWLLEGVAFEIWQPLRHSGQCPPNTLPVYRLWNGRSDSNHRYTINPDTRDDMINKGWIPEGYGPDGVVMCSPII